MHNHRLLFSHPENPHSWKIPKVRTFQSHARHLAAADVHHRQLQRCSIVTVFGSSPPYLTRRPTRHSIQKNSWKTTQFHKLCAKYGENDNFYQKRRRFWIISSVNLSQTFFGWQPTSYWQGYWWTVHAFRQFASVFTSPWRGRYRSTQQNPCRFVIKRLKRSPNYATR